MSVNSDEIVNRLYKAVTLLRDEEECAEFFKDLCTAKEIEDMAQRFETALMLYGGENYTEVSGRMGISTATISRVSKCLKKKGGYVKVIERMKENSGK